VVVAVGLTFIDPVADVDVNVPGVMAILVAPAVAQLSVLLAPEFMPVGLAAKELIVGSERIAGDEFEEPQSTSPRQAKRMRINAQRFDREELSSRQLNLFRPNELVESMRNPKQTQSIAHAGVPVALRGPSPLDHLCRFISQFICVIRHSTIDISPTIDLGFQRIPSRLLTCPASGPNISIR
jgi:hypothetical protein